jgi:hypothetical protein
MEKILSTVWVISERRGEPGFPHEKTTVMGQVAKDFMMMRYKANNDNELSCL